MRLVVLKLGGSLLLRPDLPCRLRRVLSELAGSRILMIVGGGTAADVVRDWSHTHQLAEEPAHWLAVKSLCLTRTLIQRLMPELREVSSPDAGTRFWRESKAPLLLNVDAFLRHLEPIDPSPLPHTWDVTSDSIAAWVAVRWAADELCLLKSTDLDWKLTVKEARCAGLVDNHFPHVAPQVPLISWCNLATDEPQRTRWVESGNLVPGATSPAPDLS